MASYYSSRRPSRSNQSTTAARTAANTPDKLLAANIDQLRANITGVQVGDKQPQYWGRPQAAAADQKRLDTYLTEARKRELRRQP